MNYNDTQFDGALNTLKTNNRYLTSSFHKRREFRRVSHGRLAYTKGFSSMKTVKVFI
jgi:hypothetical protein